MDNKDYSLFDHLIEGIQVISKDYKYLYVNDALATHLGVKKESMIGKGILERFPMLKEHDLYHRIRQCMTERIIAEDIRSFKLRDGSTVWAEIKTQPYETGLFIMSSDITQQKEAELLVQEKDSYYRDLFEQLQEGFIVQKVIKDAVGKVIDFRIEEINKLVAQAFGQPKEKLIGVPITKILGPLNERALDIAKRVVVEKEIVKFVSYYPTIKRWIQVASYSPKPDYIAAFLTDVTQIKEYERQLAKLNQELELMVNNRTIELVDALDREKKINDLKSNVISMTSHELKTPLAAIKLCVAVLEKLNVVPNKEERKEYYGYIKEEASNLLDMLDRFSENAPLLEESPQEAFDLSEMITKLTKELKGMCQERQKIIYKSKGEKLLKLDEIVLRRILLNLLSNAIKYSKEDVLIKTKVKKGTLNIKIIDQGIGIPKLEQRQLFNKFFRATNATSIQGTGLGLHIVKSYVEQMNGTIKFKSKKNKGTSFIVKVPIIIM